MRHTSNLLSKGIQFSLFLVKLRRVVVRWHVTGVSDTWNNTGDMWHVTGYRCFFFRLFVLMLQSAHIERFRVSSMHFFLCCCYYLFTRLALLPPLVPFAEQWWRRKEGGSGIHLAFIKITTAVIIGANWVKSSMWLNWNVRCKETEFMRLYKPNIMV